MSYSYIKSVFPNFETSKVYGEDLYNNINIKTDETSKQKELPKSFIEDKYNGTDLQPVIPKQQIEEITQKDNLKFYNIPFTPVQTVPSLKEETKQETGEIKEKTGIEKFESLDNGLDHSKYILHVMNCKRCKESLIKQFNILDDQLKMEGYIELASYIIFGIFILLLIDTISKK